MGMLSLEKFVDVIEAIHGQAMLDKCNAEMINQVFNGSFSGYDNTAVIKSNIMLLQEWFPRDTNGHCEIEHYCFELNFGKASEDVLITPEDLYFKLTEGKSVND
jgi:hypothetical protein